MKAAEEVRNAEVGKEDEEEVYYAENVVNYLWFDICDLWFVFYPRPVELDGIDEHGDKCPSFFRIPAPITSPRHIRPNGTDENTGGKAEESRVEEYLG